ncbi:glycoside hydrolase family 55 protein [Streptomyces sp. AC550_RSS872]|uniref:glycoside hydrolase family 55 protein n=1 Tax=Streptomyces sp. AC550_RSS872 TaxID=2823689 RepID=UPI001C258A11
MPNVAFVGYNLGKDVPRLTATLNVQDFGAFPDTPENSSGKFNAALDAAGRLGGGVVRIPAGTYQLDGVVLLGSDGVVLQGRKQQDDPQGEALSPGHRWGEQKSRRPSEVGLELVRGNHLNLSGQATS